MNSFEPENHYWTTYWTTHQIIENEHPHCQVGRTVNKIPIDQQKWEFHLNQIEQILNLNSSDTLLDLCAGNGLITMPLSLKCQSVTAVDISNTFTPNNDGINDLWEIKGLENYPNVLVRVFTRNGQKVFESTGYAHRFDGQLNGSPLPSGVYYYIINLQSGCSLLSGSLTLIR